MTLRLGKLFTVCTLLFVTSGCWDIKSLGGGPIPVYTLPEKVELTEDQFKLITEFRNSGLEQKKLVDTLKRQTDAYRKIVEDHNEWAKQINKARLKAMGFEQKDLEALRGE